jgi:hypothetical protein
MTRLIVSLLVIGMLATAAACAWAQDDMESATPPGMVVLVPQWYELDETGNQSSVREYDGRNFDLVDISEFMLSGLNDQTLYSVLFSHPIAGDAQAEVLIDQSYWLSFEAMFNSLSHRFADDRNALVLNGTPTFENRVPWAPGDPLPPLGTDVLEVLGPDGAMMTRDETTIGAGFTPAWLGGLRLAGSFWREREQGDQILSFRDEASPSADRRKVVLQAPLDRQTTEEEVGFDGGGGTLAYAYRHGRREFSNAPPPDLSAAYGMPANSMLTPSNHTDVDEADARLQVGSDAWLTAGWVDRKRTNEFDNGHYKLRTMNANFATRLGRDLHLTARWRDSSQDLNSIGPDSGDTVTSRDLTTASVDAHYYGISRTVLRASWLRRDVDRTGDKVGEPGLFAPSSTTNTWTAGFTHRPTRGMSLRVDYRHDNTDDPAFNIIATDEEPPRPAPPPPQTLLPYAGALAKVSKVWKANLTYAPTGTYSLYADYRDQKDDRDEVNYHSADKEWSVGGWAALSDRWSAHAEASRIEGDNGINWVVIGRTTDPLATPDDPTDDVPQDLPWPPPENVVYDYHSHIYSAGLTFEASPRLRLFSNWYRTTADGTLAPKDWDAFTAPDVINSVSPLDLTIAKYSVGVAWNLDPLTSIIAEAGRECWTDDIDATQSGKAKFVTLSLRKRM